MNRGRLLQPYVSLMWGDTNLTPYEHHGIKEIMAQNFSVQLTKSEEAPGCSFEIVASAPGMQLFQKLKKEAIDQEIKVTLGYPNGNDVSWKFMYAGLSYTTGLSPKIEITATASIKGAWTDNKISFTSEEEISLEELPELLMKKSGAKGLRFEWAGKTKEDAATIKVQPNRINQTSHNILTDVLREHGMKAEVSDAAFDNTVVISYSPNMKGQLDAEKVELREGGEKPEPAKRSIYIVGPGIMTDITRKQSFNLGQTDAKDASSSKATSTSETEAKKVAKGSNAARAAAEAQNQGSTVGPADKPKSRSETKKDNPNGEDARASQSKMTESSINFSIPMLPYMVGLKPRDIVVIPSLRGPGISLEDWEVESTDYSQDGQGNINISVSGKREYSGDDPMLDLPSQAAVRARCSTLTTPEAWNKMYWVQGPG